MNDRADPLHCRRGSTQLAHTSGHANDANASGYAQSGAAPRNGGWESAKPLPGVAESLAAQASTHAPRIYLLDRGPLGFVATLECCRDAVATARAVAAEEAEKSEPKPERAAVALRKVLGWLVPAHARHQGDSWDPQTTEDRVRLGAYSGAVDAWEGSTWRGQRTWLGQDLAAFSAAYAVAWGAVTQARAA